MNKEKLLKDTIGYCAIDIKQNTLNENIYSFDLKQDLHYQIDELERINFELWRVRPIDKETIKVIVRYKGDNKIEQY